MSDDKLLHVYAPLSQRPKLPVQRPPSDCIALSPIKGIKKRVAQLLRVPSLTLVTKIPETLCHW